MARHVAMLRGVNVGGHRRVPMARLRELVAGLGYDDPRTYLQSGNVVFGGPGEPPAQVARRLEEALAAAFGFDVAVVIRSPDELAAVIEADPLRDVATDPARHLVLFLAEPVDTGRVAGIDPAAFAPEAFALDGQEIHLWCPDGVHRSPLAKRLSDTRLGVAATARNWRTVERLHALAAGAGRTRRGNEDPLP